MPNWCSNELVISGEEAYLEDLIEKISGTVDGEFLPLCFNTIVPLPNHFDDTESLVFLSPERTWLLKNWGTKWEPSGTQFDFFEDHITLSFLTAWSPPTPIVATLTKMFPEASFELKYCEPGIGFAGEYFSTEGNVVRDETYERADDKYYSLFEYFGYREDSF